MEIVIFIVILGIVLFYFLGPRKGGFQPPAASAISKQSLQFFEATPSLWVNRAESTFFEILYRELPKGFHLHGKVRLEDIIRVKREVNPKLRWNLRGRVKSRHIDYLITNKAGKPILAIELDGNSHDTSSAKVTDQVKTALFEAANIPLRRVRVGQNFAIMTREIVKGLSAF